MFDYFMMIAVLILVALGILFIYSAEVNSAGVLVNDKYTKQIVWASVGFVLMILFTLYDYRKFEPLAFYFYIGLVVVLVLVPIFSQTVKGAKSWIGIGRLGIQPSEFGKLIYILFLAKFLATSTNMKPIKRFIFAMIIMIVPMGLVLIQPDLGTASVYIPIFLIMCFIAGVPLKYLLYITSFGILTILFTLLPFWNDLIAEKPLAAIRILTDTKLCGLLIAALLVLGAIGLVARFYFHSPKYFEVISYIFIIIAASLISSFILAKFLLKGHDDPTESYQLMRLISFMDPYIDPKNTGYHIIQSKIAIGAGGIVGKGFLRGTQSHLRFLPEQSTDFIFSILSEEMGFLGGCLVFALYLFILIKILYITRKCTNKYGSYICAGVFAMLVFHFLVNVGMVMGLMPITGIPLMFLSYGGSSMITAMCSIGVVMSINCRKTEFN